MINIKKNTLEKIINSEISEMIYSPWCDTMEFAIAETDGFQVIVRITRDEHKFTNWVLSEYLEGED